MRWRCCSCGSDTVLEPTLPPSWLGVLSEHRGYSGPRLSRAHARIPATFRTVAESSSIGRLRGTGARGFGVFAFNHFTIIADAVKQHFVTSMLLKSWHRIRGPHRSIMGRLVVANLQVLVLLGCCTSRLREGGCLQGDVRVIALDIVAVERLSMVHGSAGMCIRPSFMTCEACALQFVHTAL